MSLALGFIFSLCWHLLGFLAIRKARIILKIPRERDTWIYIASVGGPLNWLVLAAVLK